MRQKARQSIARESQERLLWYSSRPLSRTLGYGMTVAQRGSQHSCHVFLFLVRRLAFAACIVFAYENVDFGAYALILTSFAMLSLNCKTALWREKLINIQFIGNELFLLVICSFMLILSGAYNGILSYQTEEKMASIVIGIVIAFMVFNVLVILLDAWQTISLCCRRIKVIKRKREERVSL